MSQFGTTDRTDLIERDVRTSICVLAWTKCEMEVTILCYENWYKFSTNGVEMLLEKPDVKNCDLFRGYIWHSVARHWHWRYTQTDKKCAVYVCCQDQRLDIVYGNIALLEKKKIHSRYLSIKMFRNAACLDYLSTYNFHCNKWLLWIGMRTSDYPVGFPLSPSCYADCCQFSIGLPFINWCRLLYGTKLPFSNIYCI